MADEEIQTTEPVAAVETPPAPAPDPDRPVDNAVREAMSLLADGAAPGEVRPRGPDGKFIAKDKAEEPAPAAPATKAKESTGQDSPKAPEAQTSSPAPSGPPAGWPADAKAKWASLDPAIQAAVLKRETETSDGFRQKSEELKAWKGIDQLLVPHRQRFANMGYRNDGEAIGTLLTFSEMFVNNPAGLIQHLAKESGIDLNKLAATMPPAAARPAVPAQPVRQPQPDIQSVVQRELMKHDAGREFERFTANGAHPHATRQDVREAMAQAIVRGAKTLDEAYEAAVWSFPDIRPTLLEEHTNGRAQATAAKAQQARQAAVSPRPGSPTGPAVNGQAALPAGGTAYDAVRAAIASLSG